MTQQVRGLFWYEPQWKENLNANHILGSKNLLPEIILGTTWKYIHKWTNIKTICSHCILSWRHWDIRMGQLIFNQIEMIPAGSVNYYFQ